MADTYVIFANKSMAQAASEALFDVTRPKNKRDPADISCDCFPVYEHPEQAKLGAIEFPSPDDFDFVSDPENEDDTSPALTAIDLAFAPVVSNGKGDALRILIRNNRKFRIRMILNLIDQDAKMTRAQMVVDGWFPEDS